MIGQCLSKLIVITLLICTINLAIANEHSDLVSYVPSYAFFNHDRTVAVSTQKKRKGTQVFVFLKSDEQFIKLDISAVEGMNLGKLGRHSLDYYDRVESKPTEWIVRDDDKFQINIQTRAWKNGRRMTVLEWVLMDRDAKVLWR